MAKTQPRGGPAAEPLLLPPPPPPPPYLTPHPPSGLHATTPSDDGSYVILVPVRLRRRLRRGCRCGCVAPVLASLVLLALAFLLWPSDPGVSVARLRLAHVSVVARPAVALNVSAALKARVRNPNLFALGYSRLDVAIGYRGRPLGTVSSGGGLVRARAVSYVDADLHLDGIRVVEDAVYLLEDLARGSIPFDAVVEVEGHLHFFFLSVPVKGRIACVVHVNPHDQTIVHQDCYPK
ncbi:uncharacterized protein LOC123447269 [Hordeum vulgare subsp. vulgare]|uniref:Predicted protein n=1 Tax=Hordeum vulgare subsp. vulgare TaxID=112509 RepID=F2DUN7_HORVV|nr:uncharacterized protein LOC123447269 [Hordeum vulgare subsp. vulgare]BAJ98808.1 predicted protein [Hordeum vulgare subsp. vulgare]